jgi:uncharacterized protein (TIGR01244 family)
MPDFHIVTAEFSVSPQISLADVSAARARGFTFIINNRPDGESPDQPAGADIEAAARAEGLGYMHIPVKGLPTPDQADAVRAAIETARGPTLAYCRSGTRSIIAWSLGELAAGARGRDELLGLAAAAGYDLSGVLPR